MRVLKVQGKSEISARPDMVTLSFEVAVKAHDYAGCLDKLHEATESLRQSMEQAGIDRVELKTGDYGITTDTQYHEGKHTFLGYRASHRLHIELPLEKELLNRVLQQVAEGRSNASIHLTFSVRDKEGLRRRALAVAVRAAQENAAALAAAAGVKLGALQQIDYGWTEILIHEHSMDADCRTLVCRNVSPDIEPEDVSTGDSVTLVYEIA